MTTCCWYVCGPTVYDRAHLGHARTYVTVDIAKRLASRYSPIVLAMNITDVDDKIIERAALIGVDPADVARQFEASFWTSMQRLGVHPPDIVGRVTESIDLMVESVQFLLKKNKAYTTEDGSVYYNSTGAIVSTAPTKLCPEDFALWKATEGAGTFPSPWGQGRPGWHLECAVLIPKLLGPTSLNLHWGGIDLKFPHHCNETTIRAALDDVAPPWRFEYVGHLHIDGLKMSKSLKNFIAVDDALLKYTADELRLTFARHAHDATMNWSEDAVVESRSMLRKFEAMRSAVRNPSLRTAPLGKRDHDAVAALQEVQHLCRVGISIQRLPRLLEQLSTLSVTVHDTVVEAQASVFVDTVLNTIGIGVHDSSDKLLGVVHKIRADLRSAKHYELSDRIRDVYLPEVGVCVSDAQQ